MSVLTVLRICFDYPAIFSSGLQKIVSKEEGPIETDDSLVNIVLHTTDDVRKVKAFSDPFLLVTRSLAISLLFVHMGKPPFICRHHT